MSWPLSSSAERRLKAALPNHDRVTKQLFLEYHEDLLKRCKLKNYHQRDRRPLDDLELLADLQHHGAATCLLDFTRNALVALWFACARSDAPGKVFVVNTADVGAFLEVTVLDIRDKSIAEILTFSTRGEDKEDAAEDRALRTSPRPCNWYWTPAHLNERITAQHSLFVFGQFPSDGIESWEVSIASDKKGEILQELAELHDIREESLFPDFVGFSQTQGVDSPYPLLGVKGHLRDSVRATQRGQYLEAIQASNRAIEIQPDSPKAYLCRGLAYVGQENFGDAIKDIDKAIALKPDLVEAHLLRCAAHFNEGKHSQAVRDATRAIELGANFSELYLFRGSSHARLRDYDQALDDFTKGIEIGPDSAGLYFLRAATYLIKGRGEDAVRDFVSAIKELLGPRKSH